MVFAYFFAQSRNRPGTADRAAAIVLKVEAL
jgi:hypothetical protein